jgi:hypothetical protein
MLVSLCLLLTTVAPLDTQRPPPPARVNRALLISGTAALATSYLASAGTASLSETISRSLPVVPAQTSSLGSLFIPIAGPFIALGDIRNRTPGRAVLLVVDGVVQVTAATLIVLGLVLPHQPSRSWTLAPGVQGSSLGATFSVQL